MRRIRRGASWRVIRAISFACVVAACYSGPGGAGGQGDSPSAATVGDSTHATEGDSAHNATGAGTGTTGGPGNGPASGSTATAGTAGVSPEPMACEAPDAFAVPLARLTKESLRGAVDALFGPGLVYVDAFPAALQGYAYSSYAAANPLGSAQVLPFLETAESIAMAAVDRVPACNGDESACVTAYLGPLVERAFRRTATPGEFAIVEKLFRDARTSLDYRESVGIALFGLLQMPQFLYAWEEQPAAAAGVLTGLELAQRMALVFWNSLPDESLEAAARDGSLLEPDVRRAQATRLLGDPRGRAALLGFFLEWMMVRDYRSTQHDAALQAALREELVRVIDAALQSPNSIEALLSSPKTQVNSVLEAFYGLPTVSTGPDDWREVELPAAERVGILTHPVLMSRFAHGDSPSVILRGKFVRLSLLCSEIQSPPAGAQEEQAALTPMGATIREQSEARLQHPRCGGCHRLMDPIGFGFSAFDGTGRFHPEIAALAGETKGTVAPPFDQDGDFEGVRQLGDRLAASPQVRACFARQFLRYAFGKKESRSEDCAMDRIAASLAESHASFADLFAAIAAHPAFTERLPPEGG